MEFYNKLNSGESLKGITRDNVELTRDYTHSNHYALLFTRRLIVTFFIIKIMLSMFVTFESGINLFYLISILILLNTTVWLLSSLSMLLGSILKEMRIELKTSDSYPVAVSEDIIIIYVENDDVGVVSEYAKNIILDISFFNDYQIKKIKKGTKGNFQFAEGNSLNIETKESLKRIIFETEDKQIIETNDQLIDFLVKK